MTRPSGIPGGVASRAAGDEGRGRPAILAMTLLCLAVSVLALARLGVSVAAMPPALLLVEPVRYIDPGVRAGPAALARADAAAALVDDAGLIRTRIEHCRPGTGMAVDRTTCLGAVDDALRASPSSGELWLLRATLLSQFGEFGEPLSAALRNSYAAAPLEGWIVVPRLGFELSLYPLLPGDLKEQARKDLATVLADTFLANAFAPDYAHNPAMREAGRPAFDTMPPELVARFAAFVRDAAETAAREARPG